MNADLEPSWDLYRTALAVLEEGSLSGAARALGLTQPTVGRQIEALEAQLGVALFSRSQLGLTPTDAAQALRPYAETLRATSAALARTVRSEAEAISGAVRITASEVVSAEVLPAILTPLRHAHPALAVELVASDRTRNLLQRDADIAVRMTQPEQGALLAQKVGRISVGCYAHRDYLAQYGIPRQLADLAHHHLIGYDRLAAYMRGLGDWSEAFRPERLALRTDNSLVQLAAVRAGLGVGFCQHGLARRNPDLQAVLPQDIEIGFDTWIVMHADLRASRRYRLVFDALVTGMGEYLNGT
ncbi:LysR family transcriptional regulator [Chitinimonas sp.]|uniref:LysR family transcriptional regulator n=1 Tax=Chitinimonas sp. TaxID=1934313 RepID=UPI002F9556B5